MTTATVAAAPVILRLALAALLAAAAWSADPPPPHPDRVLAAPNPGAARLFREQVWPVLEARCLRCHDAKKDYGDLRLDTLAGMLEGGEDGTALVPGEPERSTVYTSTLWLPGHHRMPPLERIPEAESQVLRRWIELGALWPEELRPGAPAPPPAAPLPVPLAGRLHPALVHLPIGAALLAALAEALAWWRGPRWRPATGLALGLGVAGSILAIASGLQLEAAHDPAVLATHERLGWIAGALIAAAGLAALARIRWPAATWALRALLAAALVATVLAGHAGGAITHGSGWLGW